MILSLDNGTTAHFAVLDMNGKLIAFQHVPTLKEAKWTKPKKDKRTGQLKHGHYTLIDIDKFTEVLHSFKLDNNDTICIMERPAISYNSKWGLDTSLSAFAAWAYMVYVFKKNNITNITIADSRAYQNYFFAEATGKYNKEYLKSLKSGQRNKLLKKASDEVSVKLFPGIILKDSGDGDSLVMGEYYRRKIKGELKDGVTNLAG